MLRPLHSSIRRLASSSLAPEEIANFGRLAGDWWDPKGPMKALHSMNQLRVPWIAKNLAKQSADPRLPLADRRLVDLGCGAGVLSEPLARLGATVTGLDASPECIAAAKKHQRDLPGLQYKKPGGSLFITTINRTIASQILAINVAEDLLRIVPRGTHHWHMYSCIILFVPPEDLESQLDSLGLTTRLIHGIAYLPVLDRWKWIDNPSVNYALLATKPG